jgi:hypothetical protein
MGLNHPYTRITLFTAAFLVVPMAAFVLLLAGMLSRRFWGLA